MNKKTDLIKERCRWVIKTTLFAFFASFIFSLISEVTIPNASIVWGFFLIIIFILIGIIFDILGIAVASAEIKVFHSMNAQKIKGADVAVTLIKNAARVSSFCNDVVGDICGVVSGSAGAMIATNLAKLLKVNSIYVSLVVTSLIAGLTIGGKALGKNFAINRSHDIVYQVSKFASHFYKPKNKRS